MPPDIINLNSEISEWIREMTPTQTGHFAQSGKYKSIKPIEKNILSYLSGGILSGSAIEYVSPDGAGLMGVFTYSISGQIWRKTMNFVVDTDKENWRNKGWVKIN